MGSLNYVQCVIDRIGHLVERLMTVLWPSSPACVTSSKYQPNDYYPIHFIETET
jgi:hypothetical protein